MKHNFCVWIDHNEARVLASRRMMSTKAQSRTGNPSTASTGRPIMSGLGKKL